MERSLLVGTLDNDDGPGPSSLTRLEPIMLLKLPIMLLSSATKSSLLCSEIQIMLIGTMKFNTLKLYST